MERYDYKAAVREDVLQYIRDNDISGRIDSDLQQKLFDEMFISDSVTGNASGSYTFNTWKAEENICHNMDLVAECVKEFGMDLARGAEVLDSGIRCYLLQEVLDDVVREWNAGYREQEDE